MRCTDKAIFGRFVCGRFSHGLCCGGVGLVDVHVNVVTATALFDAPNADGFTIAAPVFFADS